MIFDRGQVPLENSLANRFVSLPILGEENVYICDDGVNCTFLRDVNGRESLLNKCFEKHLPLHEILLEWFRFYYEVDFSSVTLCIISGQLKTKLKRRDFQNCLDLTNPLQPDQNVSINVSQKTIQLFQQKCAASQLALLKVIRDEIDEDGGRMTDLFSQASLTPKEKNLNLLKDIVSSRGKENARSPSQNPQAEGKGISVQIDDGEKVAETAENVGASHQKPNSQNNPAFSVERKFNLSSSSYVKQKNILNSEKKKLKEKVQHVFDPKF